MLHQTICRTCGRTFEGGPRAWYCPDCRAEKQREYKRIANYHQRTGTARKIGSLATCERCGEKYEVTNGLQRYCRECAPVALREIDRKQGLDYYTTNRDIINPPRNAKRRQNRKANKSRQPAPQAGEERKYMKYEVIKVTESNTSGETVAVVRGFKAAQAVAIKAAQDNPDAQIYINHRRDDGQMIYWRPDGTVANF